jgi:hypothetical protein
MENSFFIFTDKEEIVIERFHICTWEFKDRKPLIEFGAEISKNSIKDKDSLCLSIYIPWLTDECKISDLYKNLSNFENSRFIFNDSIEHIDSLDGGKNRFGVIYTFKERKEKLCILPVNITKSDCIISINLPLNKYQYQEKEKEKEGNKEEKPNIYFRFLIKPAIQNIPTIIPGIGKSTIIYDIKINEQRNIPDDKIVFFEEKKFCKIKTCFLFNIIPNKYDITFFENRTLKSIRTLEYNLFKKYLPDSRVKRDDLIVIFNKKESPEDKEFPSYSFFAIYSKEIIGMGQFAVAILINIFCGFLLFLLDRRGISLYFLENLSPELCLGFFFLITFLYLFYIPIKNWVTKKITYVIKWVIKKSTHIINWFKNFG